MTAPVDTPEAGEVLFEFIALGASVKVAAVDAATGVEVSVVGPSSAARSDLEKLALRKLLRVLKKHSAHMSKAPTLGGGGLLA